MSLPDPHGGELVDRWIAANERGTRGTIRLDADAVRDAVCIADGTFSPLDGFLNREAIERVAKDMRLPDGTLWPVPVHLPVPDDAEPPEVGMRYEIADEQGPMGVIAVREVATPDWDAVLEGVWGTKDPSHPGVARCLSRGRRVVAGPIRLWRRPSNAEIGRWEATPEKTREAIVAKGWSTCTGFQTRNLGHRAHEHLQKIALEVTDGLLIHPLVGWKKSGDMLPETVLEGYELLRDLYFPADRTLLFGLVTAMRYAGPREAVFHALIRKNHGCTHFIVGRDHAGVGSWYDTYAAHELMRSIPSEDLGITPLLLKGPRWCRACGEITSEAVCPHGEDQVTSISGTEVRAMVARGERPPAEIMRVEIADFLIARDRDGRAFHRETTES